MSRPLSRRHSRTAARGSVQDVALLFAPTPASSKRLSRHERHASLAGADDLASVVPGTYSSADQRRSLRLSRASVASASVLFASFGQDLFALPPDGHEESDRQSALEKLEGRSASLEYSPLDGADSASFPLTPEPVQGLHTLIEEEEEEDDLTWPTPPAPHRSYSTRQSSGQKKEREAARTQLNELRTRLEASEKRQATLTASWDAERTSMNARIESLKGRLASTLSAQESSKSSTSQLEEQLQLTQRERDEYLDDISGWRQRCAELEGKLASETERADTQACVRAGLAAKALSMTPSLPAEAAHDLELTSEELAPALVSMPRRCERPTGIPVGPSPEATVQLLGAMRQQIISLARTLAQEREERAQASAQKQADAPACTSPEHRISAARAHSPLLGSAMRTRRSSHLTTSTTSTDTAGRLSISTAPTSRGGSTSSFFEHSAKPVNPPRLPVVEATSGVSLPQATDYNPTWSFASAAIHPLPKTGIFPLPESEGEDFFQLGTELTLPPLSWAAKDLPPTVPQAQQESLLSLTSQAISGLGGYLFSSARPSPPTAEAVAPRRTIPRVDGRRPISANPASSPSASVAENVVFV